ncbi:uncharacterized protein LOC120084179 [Benincasa hispida]|uniref:uncharacterized protein LOC120084179 n=1 Tax=Benincasa hispida TaxID=102211 RepID=UPI00190036C9|nr:uncharacterized protein LOC120084179 [Benincasa hispida]
MRDLGNFTIPCLIGGMYIGHASCDLGASINLMPQSIFKKLEIGETSRTIVTVQLADRSLVQPEGNLEDVLVKVDKFILPTDFIILDYETDKDVPIILGRPFLSIGRTQIDVHKGEITMHINGQQLIFYILKVMNYPEEIDVYEAVALEDEWPCELKFEFNEDMKLEDDTTALPESVVREIQRNFKLLSMDEREGKVKPSLEQSPVLDLKALFTHLRYTFFG